MITSERNTPLVSIVVPVYQVEKYLDKCINSIINQDFINYEILLVDDGSPDKCGEICDKYAKEHSNIVVIHKENGGLSDARNAGVKAASGTYIIFVDSDDYVDSDYISTLWNIHEKYGTDIVFSAIIKENDDKKERKKSVDNGTIICESIDNRKAQALILNGETIGTSACGKLINKAICEKIPFPKGKLMEDLRTIYYMLNEVNYVGVITKPTYHYVQRSGSILHNTYSIIDAQEYINLAKNFIEIAPTNEVRNAAYSRLIYICSILTTGASKEERHEIFELVRQSIKPSIKYLLAQKDISYTKKIRAVIFSMPDIVIRLSVVLSS